MNRAISASVSTVGPGKYSPADHSANAGDAAIARLSRTASISAAMSSGFREVAVIDLQSVPGARLDEADRPPTRADE